VGPLGRGDAGARLDPDAGAAPGHLAAQEALRPGGFRARQLLLIPAKDLLFGLAWAQGLLRSEVTWRGNRIRVEPGTRIAPAEAAHRQPQTARVAS
jgi:hypothetical protein